ncbi:MAG TPA: hypothetical protein VGA13_03605 [Acidimicrobiales bacterium]
MEIDGVDWDDPDVQTRFVQPYEATKSYRCPGCDHDVAEGTHHIVAVPSGQPDLRRHWHRGCWNNRHRQPRSGRRR